MHCDYVGRSCLLTYWCTTRCPTLFADPCVSGIFLFPAPFKDMHGQVLVTVTQRQTVDSEAFHPGLNRFSELKWFLKGSQCVSVMCQYPVCVQNMQSVHEGHYSLLQRIQSVLLGVLVSEVVPQAPQRISEQLHLLRLQARHQRSNSGVTSDTRGPHTPGVNSLGESAKWFYNPLESTELFTPAADVRDDYSQLNLSQVKK